MVVRKRKRKNKYRGERSFGAGNIKNRRGSGCKGGKGRAGSHKHKYSKYYATFGIKKKLKAKRRIGAVMNLDQLSQRIVQLLEEKKVEKKEGNIIIDGSKIDLRKILSKGNITAKVIVRNVAVSKKAKEKIEKAGGRVEEKKKKEKVEKKIEKGVEEVGKKGKEVEEKVRKEKMETNVEKKMEEEKVVGEAK